MRKKFYKGSNLFDWEGNKEKSWRNIQMESFFFLVVVFSPFFNEVEDSLSKNIF